MTPNQALQETRRVRYCCNWRVSGAGSLGFILLVLLAGQLGCDRRSTGLLEIFKTDALPRAAGVSQGAVIQKSDKIEDLSSSSNPAMQTGCYGDFDIRLASGSCGQFLTNYQAEVIKALTDNGAGIVQYEAPPGGLDSEEGIFRYLFATPQRQGSVRVIWGTHETNHYEMIVVFSEGRK